MSPDGKEFTLDVVGPGQVFGEMSLTAQRLENAYVEAMDPSVVCAMKRNDLEWLVKEKPQVSLKVVSVLSERLSRTEDRIKGLMNPTPPIMREW